MAISSGSVHIQDPIVLMAHSDRLQRFSQRRDWLFPSNVRSKVISIRWNVRCMNIFWWNCKNRLATICYNLPRIRTFVWNAWKSRGCWTWKGVCIPILKILLTGLPSKIWIWFVVKGLWKKNSPEKKERPRVYNELKVFLSVIINLWKKLIT